MLVKDNLEYDVFISFKKTDELGGLTLDFTIAQKITQALKQHNINTFFSEDSLEQIGSSAYKADIDRALDSAQIMIVVLTKSEYASSQWVQYEWDSFYNDFLSGVKKNAKLFTYTSGVNVQDLPRSLRNVQNFTNQSKTIDEVCEYIINALGPAKSSQTTDGHDGSLVKRLHKINSLYTSATAEELERLKIQANIAKNADDEAIGIALSNFSDKRNLNVLDIGCAYGYISQNCFNDNVFSQVVGIDKEEECINYAKKEFEDKKYSYYQVDITSENFNSAMEKIKQEKNINNFDIIYISMVLHFLGNDIIAKVLRNFRKHMSSDGIIIVRSSDDGSDLAYNDDGLMEKIIQLTLKAKGIEDRYNGRKIFGYLINAGFKDIIIKSFMRDTTKYDIDNRYLMFEDAFSWRLEDFKQSIKNDPKNKEYEKNYSEMKELLELFENKFYEKDFWFCEYDYIGIAKR